jgi:hypothetical protein
VKYAGSLAASAPFWESKAVNLDAIKPQVENKQEGIVWRQCGHVRVRTGFALGIHARSSVVDKRRSFTNEPLPSTESTATFPLS